ncbi:MAG: DUF938 domain-containing protein [Pseudoruegeria sp.]
MSHPPRVVPCHSNVKPMETKGKLSAPSAERNQAAILEVLAQYAPTTGTALEIASGTGQHSVAFAKQHPKIQWQPTDIIEERLTSIAVWRAEHVLDNLRPPVRFDAILDPVPETQINVVITINLLHLIGEDECWTILRKVAGALAPNGYFLFYGPFRRDNGFASEDDRDFHHKLQAMDPSIGYKEVRDMKNWIRTHGLTLVKIHDMPSNNLMWVVQKSG